MLLDGEGNIGKTMIVEKLVRSHSDLCNAHNKVDIRSTTLLQVPAPPWRQTLCQIEEGLGIDAPITRRAGLSLLGLRLMRRNPHRAKGFGITKPVPCSPSCG